MQKGPLIILIAAIILLMMMLCGCELRSVEREVKIVRSNYSADDISIPLIGDEDFAKQAYSIVETDNGYDIVIHVEVKQCDE